MPDPSQFITPASATEPFFVGIDLGGTNIKVGLVDDRGRTLSWHAFPTERERGAEDGARRMGLAVKRAADEAGLDPGHISQVGLGSPGTMDVPAGMLIEPHNLGWFNFPIRDAVSRHAGLPVAFANDANAAAYGEYWIGAGSDYNSMVLFTLGTGIGCGVIIGDRSIDGEHSHGAECGHLIINDSPDARRCGCGQTGHLEAYASATAVVQIAAEALAAGEASSLAERTAAGAQLTPLLIAQEAERGDALAGRLVSETARHVGVGAVNLMHTIDPDGVVLGGAMTFGGEATALGRQFLETVRDEIRRRAFPVLAQRTHVGFASLGADAGYIGAAGIARIQFRRERSGR